MAETPLPSREEMQDWMSGVEQWELVGVSGRTIAAVLSRRLVDREAIDWETVGRIMWDTMFHDIDHWDGLPEKDKQVWLHELPIGFDAALGDG